mmetsp:Transcript_31194/g.56580  ORF Transcript_31194/g.56580 Transcript_31194/m.56580 type:complete len:394 (-) Transcript_31194:175-1356(-)|eukprot:CAMPEP_0197663074 /NCGR_PEP_ID=MMETSP1338-20131121/56006_1 /TAXON_ID=43686 ORGANISM="Pelagodinium beii, Strain RCC1491" /NCGR_SAMPLE_ID=MMETSP1338 /ASSEMBLY_ACC=CAM_ASM_000754 /LENGTH=393 /DNA_ID=CAMNT_0043241267 /DNA_START=79 /DNA_END=1260 /DNA_ORIENTATION=+
MKVLGLLLLRCHLASAHVIEGADQGSREVQNAHVITGAHLPARHEAHPQHAAAGGSREVHMRRMKSIQVDHHGVGSNEAELVQQRHAHAKRHQSSAAAKDRVVPLRLGHETLLRVGSIVVPEAQANENLSRDSFLGGVVVGLLIAVIGGSILLSCRPVKTMKPSSSATPTCQEAAGLNARSASTEFTITGTENHQAAGEGALQQGDDRLVPAGDTIQAEAAEFGPVETLQLFWPRCFWLASMLLIQSISSFILSRFQSLIDSHDDIIFFLTMLVGLGGNAGGQSVVLTVRKLAQGQQDISFLGQVRVGFMLCLVLGPLAWLRAYASGSDVKEALTIALSAGAIVIAATGIGTAIPLALHRIGFDPGQASSMIQVIMDILGISIVCSLGVLILK